MKVKIIAIIACCACMGWLEGSAENLATRTEVLHPQGKVIIADEPLPDPVYRAQKNIIQVFMRLHEKGNGNHTLLAAASTGVVCAPGIIHTVRHLYLNSKFDFEETMKAMGKKIDYEVEFTGRFTTENRYIDFPLSLDSPDDMGPLGTFKDFLLLRVDPRIMGTAVNPPQESSGGDTEDNVSPGHPNLTTKHQEPFPTPKDEDAISTLSLKKFYRFLFGGLKFVDQELDEKNIGDTFYVSGFAPINGFIPQSKNGTEMTKEYDQVDVVKYTYRCELTAIIKTMPINTRGGIKTIYRLRGKIHPGFSGGPALDTQGNVVGVVNASSDGFVYVISSRDVHDFWKDRKILK